MCSEHTPRARILDTRIPQLMQPWSSPNDTSDLWLSFYHYIFPDYLVLMAYSVNSFEKRSIPFSKIRSKSQIDWIDFPKVLFCTLPCDPLYGRGFAERLASIRSSEYNAGGYKTIGYIVDRQKTLCYKHNGPWRVGGDTDQLIAHQGNRVRGLPPAF